MENPREKNGLRRERLKARFLSLEGTGKQHKFGILGAGLAAVWRQKLMNPSKLVWFY